jgi:phage-related protein
VARVIAEAAVRLVTDRKGLAGAIRRDFRAAIKEATAGSSLFDGVERDSDATSSRVSRRWTNVLNGLKSSLGGLVGGLAGIGKLLLIGTAAAGAVAGVTSLTTAVAGLGSALITASGIVGLLPAALAGIAAIKGTLALGLSGVSEGFKAVAEDATTFNEAIKNLAPNAQEFLRAIRAQKGAFDDLRLDVQNRLFVGLADAVKPLAEKYLPLASRLFVTIAGSLNNAAREATSFALSGQTVGKVGTLFDNLRASVESLSGAFAPAIAALLDITTVGSTFLPRMSDAIAGASNRFAEFIREAAQSGQLEEFFQRAIDTIKQLGRIAGNVFGGLGNVMSAAKSQGAGLLNTLESITQAFQTWTGSTSGQEALKSFFASMKRVVEALGPPFFALIEVIGRDFIPILADIATIIGPVLKPLFETFGRLLQALRPLIDAIASAFGTALAALGPFFDALGEAITDAMPVLGPLIQEIGEAFAQLFQALVPLAPVFVELLEALLPIVPPLIQMVAEIMPELIDLIEALMPLIKALADAFVAALPIITDIVNFLLNVFVPIIEVVSESIAGLVILVTAVFKGIWDAVVGFLTLVGEFFTNVWNDITRQVGAAWDAITGFFSNGIGNALSAVGGFFVNLWNGFKTAMSNIGNAVATGVGNVVDWFKALPGRILDTISGLAGQLFNAGLNVIKGLLNGLKNAAGAVIDFFKNLIKNAISSVYSALGIGSPSKVFHQIGVWVGEGMVNGLKEITPAVADAANTLAGVTTDALDNPFRVGAGTVNGVAPAGSTFVTQTNVMQPGTDVKQFSDIVLRRGLGDLLSTASTLTVARNGVQAGVNDQWVGV